MAFAGPLTARWNTLDGSRLKASVDLEIIFRDRTVVHSQDPNLIHRANPFVTKEPVILIEVDHRTVSVYMLITLRLDNPESPNVFASSRERMLAYTRAY